LDTNVKTKTFKNLWPSDAANTWQFEITFSAPTDIRLLANSQRYVKSA